MSAPQSDAFKKAVSDSKKLTSKPSNDDLLELYGESIPLQDAPLALHNSFHYLDASLRMAIRFR